MPRCAVDGEMFLRTNRASDPYDTCHRHHVYGRRAAVPQDDLRPCRDKRCSRCRSVSRIRREASRSE